MRASMPTTSGSSGRRLDQQALRSDTNPGMGDAGLYYYFHTFAKALEALDQQLITDADGVSTIGDSDLVLELARRQREDGAWVNGNERWMENDANLVTAYALLALWHARANSAPQ